jgi:DNA-binding MarR family transcriptional regulator
MPSTTPSNPHKATPTHVGRWLHLALERFDARVLNLMAHHPGVPLGLANLAAREQVSAAHWHITRHLDPQGARLTDLALRADISKQAMGALVNQCEAWGMVTRCSDPIDARARRVQFTPLGLAWLGAYQDAAAQAELEMHQALGTDVATVVALGLEAYGSG